MFTALLNYYDTIGQAKDTAAALGHPSHLGKRRENLEKMVGELARSVKEGKAEQVTPAGD